jgi:5-methyltetrahydrofolate--homocysteine methyltransferase
MIEIAREYRQCSQLPVAILSNAGLPSKSETGLTYSETPDYITGKTVELLKLGVQIVGGCCGTGPDHIHGIRQAVDDFVADRKAAVN